MLQMKHLGLAAGALMLMTIASLATLLMTKADPWSSIEAAHASSLQGMGGTEIIAVPVMKDQNSQYLTVIAKTKGKSLIKGVGEQEEWMLVVYEITARGMEIHAMRPIDYDLRSRVVFGQINDSAPHRNSPTQLNPLESRRFSINLEE